jgi:hypothetical protein
MSSEKEVGAFLQDFKEKMKLRDVLFRDDRGKNAKTLLELELRPMDRKAILETLEVKNYNEAPNKDQLYSGSDLWIFGKTLKKKEVYIKISMGAAGSSVICISFHLAEHKMSYPFK